MPFEVTNNAGESLISTDVLTNDNAFKTDKFSLDLPIGTVNATQWSFDGIRVTNTESRFYEAAIFDWKGDAELVTMHFNLQGKISMYDQDAGKTFSFSGNQHNLFYGREAEGKMGSEELYSNTFLIQFTKDAFLKIAAEGNDSIKRFSDGIISGKSVAFSENNLYIDLPIRQCIDAMLNCQFNDALRKMYFLSKSIELLVLQAESFDKNQNHPSRHLKTDQERSSIHFAKDYLLNHIGCPPTLSELSKIAGINEFKLKKGFKETFHKTVFEFLSDVRLENARRELADGNKTATEIAYELGYCSLQHFSTAFKKKYNCSPKAAFNSRNKF